jgi:hypothetical protein
MSKDVSPQRKCINEAKNLYHVFVSRWEKESDLEAHEIADALTDAFDEYYEIEEDTEVEFNPDFDLGEDEQ